MARVRGATVGGLFGSEDLNANRARAGRNSWAGGVVLGSVTVGGVSGSSTGGESVTVYWDVETSGQDSSPGAGAGGHIGVTLTVAAAVTLPPAIWSHTNGAYPTLLAHDADLQGAAILAGLTRLMAIENGNPALTLQVGEENLVFGESTLRLDINGAKSVARRGLLDWTTGRWSPPMWSTALRRFCCRRRGRLSRWWRATPGARRKWMWKMWNR